MRPEIIPLSKFLSYVLRHHPAAIGLSLDEQGWIPVDQLLKAAQQSGKKLSLELLQEVVFSNDKQRFSFSADGQKIRANQGHSIAVNLALEPQIPPKILYHGTARQYLAAILSQGLQKMQRHHVHLSPTRELAYAVGQRHGKAVVLGIAAETMYVKGFQFYLAANGVWLTDNVPTEFMAVLT